MSDKSDNEVKQLNYEEMQSLQDHVKEYIGDFSDVIHQKKSEHVHLDVIPVQPTDKLPYHFFVTMGMSAKKMNVPSFRDISPYGELMIVLPKDWKVSQKDWKSKENFWPINKLFNNAIYPHENDTYFEQGHTISNLNPPQPFASNTKFVALLIDRPNVVDEDFSTLKLAEKEINFYCLVPIYKEELKLAMDQGSSSLIHLLEKYVEHYQVIDVNRINVVKELFKEGDLDVNEIAFKASVLAQRKKYDKAIQIIDDNLKQYDWSVKDDNLLGKKAEFLFRSGRYQDCVDFVWEMIDHGSLGIIDGGLPDICWIHNAYDKLIEQHPKDVNLYIKKAQAAYYTRLGCADHPIELFSKILEIDKKNIDLFPSIIELFEKMMRDNNDQSDVILIEPLMFLHYKLRNYKNVLDYFERSDIDHDDIFSFDCIEIMVKSYIAENRCKDALDFCENILQTETFKDAEEVLKLKENIENKIKMR